jgi:hypothetical protein
MPSIAAFDVGRNVDLMSGTSTQPTARLQALILLQQKKLRNPRQPNSTPVVVTSKTANKAVESN